MLSGGERRMLENWAKRRKTAQGLALRARIVLACADGGPNLAVAARLGVSRGTVTMPYGITTVQAIARVLNRDLNPAATARVPASRPYLWWGTPDERIRPGWTVRACPAES